LPGRGKEEVPKKRKGTRHKVHFYTREKKRKRDRLDCEKKKKAEQMQSTAP